MSKNMDSARERYRFSENPGPKNDTKKGTSPNVLTRYVSFQQLMQQVQKGVRNPTQPSLTKPEICLAKKIAEP